jgi:HEXXH motif-containing protein
MRHVRAGSLNVLIDDLDPFRMPAVADLALRVSTVDASKWDTALQEAWPLLEVHHPAVAAEVAEAVTVVVPLTNARGGQASSSSSATFGAVALSEPPDPYTCAATLAHEVQHLKLSALLDIVALTLPDDGQGYYAPWRPDPRPISGLLQGAYAFLGVSGFWRRQRQLADDTIRLRADTEFARWRAAAAHVVETLRSSGRLTPAGLEFIQGMSQTLDAWQDEPISAEARTVARLEADMHLARWQSENGPLRPDNPARA